MEVDGMFSRRQAMQFEVQRYDRTLVPDDNRSNILPLRVFQLNFGFSNTGSRQTEQCKKQGDTSSRFHERPLCWDGIIAK